MERISARKSRERSHCGDDRIVTLRKIRPM
jgi:hypothetical protein